MSKRVALVTCETLPELFLDDQLLCQALQKRGLDACPWIWTSEKAQTERVDLCILRNTWDYYFKPQAFLEWCRHTASRTQLWNPLELIEWNHHKSYLLKLAAQKVNTAPTLLLKQGHPQNISSLCQAANWRDIILKPAISAGAHRTGRFDANSVEAQLHAQQLQRDGDALLQPYLPGIEGYGERSLVFIDGKFTHAVKRTQAMTEGVGLDRLMTRLEPTPEEMALAEKAIAALPTPTLYARVDVAPDLNNVSAIMEVEVIEPRLFLQECPEALEILAEAIVKKLA